MTSITRRPWPDPDKSCSPAWYFGHRNKLGRGCAGSWPFRRFHWQHVVP